MNPLLILMHLLKPLLYPLALLYGAIVWLRNKLYDAGVLSSIQFSVPVISVGNLSTGGTGKTPHIEYLIELLQYEFRVGTMSRGYKRKTTGFFIAGSDSDARQMGDEPMQYFSKYPEIVVSVCEDRMTGIPQLLREHPDIDVILLDDAFQHRSVKPGVNILVTDYARPFYKDYILPFGRLREQRKAYKRAHIIIVSKCPREITASEMKVVTEQIRPLPHQKVFFTGITYKGLVNFFINEPLTMPAGPVNIVFVSGIAQPEPVLQHLRKQAANVHLLRYPDHHYFTLANIEEIKQTYLNWDAEHKIILTTEKDATRLMLHYTELAGWNIPVAVLPIKISFIKEEDTFKQYLSGYIAQEREDMLN